MAKTESLTPVNSALPPAEVDVAVLLLFFTRVETLEPAFEQIRKARPSKLFLYQDGPRGERDLPGIEACRQIVDRIDWQCEVHRNYQKVNQGCDPSNYLAQRWAFSIVEKCVVLEDDDVPSVSFFHFCKELLDRYEHDDRVTMIAGFNTDEVTHDCEADYFFSTVFSIWGWASWRRVIEKWDASYSFLDHPSTLRQLEHLIQQRGYRKDIIKMSRDHRASGKAYYESIFWTHMLLNNGLAIFPKRNLISNIGMTENSTHFSAFSTMPRGYRRIFTMQRFELEGPLRHPRNMMDHVAFKERWYRTQGWNHPWIKVCRSMEELFWNLRSGRFTIIFKAIANRISIWTGRHQHK